MKTIHSLMINDQITEDAKEIDHEIFKFYNKLYQFNIDINKTNSFFEKMKDKIHPIDEHFKSLMEADLELNELSETIAHLPLGKSPGIDGLTNEFYKHFWPHIKNLLFTALNGCIQSSTLTATMRQGLIRLIPKPNKDIQLLDNWRPITLLSRDYKMLA